MRQEMNIFKFETEIIDYEITGSPCGKNAAGSSSRNRAQIQIQRSPNQ